MLRPLHMGFSVQQEAEKKNKGGMMSMLSGMSGARVDENSDAKAAPEVAVVHATGPIFISELPFPCCMILLA